MEVAKLVLSKSRKLKMKNSIILFAIAAFLFAGCGNKKSQEHSHDGEDAHDHAGDTHQHDDGSVHGDHEDSEHSQEEFKVDSTTIKIEGHGHSHEDSTHQH